MRILVIEDEQQVAQTLQEGLERSYAVDVASSGKSGIFLATVNEYDLILLDLGLPDRDGVEVCREIRSKDIQTPLLVLTGRDKIKEKVLALDAGADDYLTKPFSFEELSARIRALMRRGAKPLVADTLTTDNLTLDVHKRRVERRGEPIALRRKEFDLLEYLMRNQERVVTRSMILEHVWDDSVDLFTNVVDVHIKYLRDKIDRPFGTQLIKTVHGLGYKIEAAPETSRREKMTSHQGRG